MGIELGFDDGAVESEINESGLEAYWKRMGSGLAADWQRMGNGLEVDWRRIGSGLEGGARIGAVDAADAQAEAVKTVVTIHQIPNRTTINNDGG